MKFKELTEYFEKLDENPSRLILIEILSELFKKLPQVKLKKLFINPRAACAVFCPD